MKTTLTDIKIKSARCEFEILPSGEVQNRYTIKTELNGKQTETEVDRSQFLQAKEAISGFEHKMEEYDSKRGRGSTGFMEWTLTETHGNFKDLLKDLTLINH